MIPSQSFTHFHAIVKHVKRSVDPVFFLQGECLDVKRPQGIHRGRSSEVLKPGMARWPDGQTSGDPKRAETAHAGGGTFGRGAMAAMGDGG